MGSDAVAALLMQVGRSWPADWQLSGLGEVSLKHPLTGEIAELRAERWGSLPYFSHSRIHWITMAPTADGLRTAISALRAWVLPSYGWEHPQGSILPPANANPSLAALLQEISPAGYFRWLSLAPKQAQVIKKLGEMRSVEQHRPPYADARELSLFELRQEFHLALATGDRDSAQQVISQIDKRQLDTAVNTQFMRIRMHDHFREFVSIVEFQRLDDLLQMRMPHAIRNAVATAFYWRFLSTADSKDQAEWVYDSAVHPRLGGLLCSCRREDGPEVDALLKHHARHAVSPSVEPSLAEQLADALRRNDWRAIQRVGSAILRSATQTIGINQEQLRNLLANSLTHYPSEDIRELLVPTVPETALPVENWPQFVAALRKELWRQCQIFLDSPERPQLRSSDVQQTEEFVLAVTELFTEAYPSIGQAFVPRALSAIAEDAIADPDFPVQGLAMAYEILFQVWAAQFRGSQKIQHRAVLLSLGQVLLEDDAKHELLIHDAIRSWWQARRTHAMLPFLIEGLELLAGSSSRRTDVQSLWYDATEVIGASGTELPRGEIEGWRAIALRAGLDEKDVETYLPRPEVPEEPEDPLQGSGLKRIAVVSLHERQARTAADIIRTRTGAEVVVDNERTPGEQTELAKRSDLILFVWAAAKHAVFRAFDSVREKVVYIQGSGAASIIRGLERWAVERRP